MSRPTRASAKRSGVVPPLGAHMSIAGGMPRAVDRAMSVEATALQVFVKSSNRWAARPFGPGEAAAFRNACRASGLERSVLAHASYLINPGSPDDALWRRSVASLRVEIERCARLGIPYLVLHPGSHRGSGARRGLERVVEALDLALGGRRNRRGEVTVLLETTAGQGDSLGAKFEDLGWILDRVKRSARVGVCFDTCHALAAGYEFRDARSYRKTFGHFDRVVGLERLAAFHLNDSKAGLGSRRDRHEHIGRGHVGLGAFRRIVNDPRFRTLPMVLETPKGEDLAEDRLNLRRLRRLVER